MKYHIGIDLGTTHCALAYVRAGDADMTPKALPVPQLVDPGSVSEPLLLPSFLYLGADGEFSEGATDLPWRSSGTQVVGTLARNLGSKTSSRLVSSAKSWLCHPGIDRRGAILPPNAPDGITRLSPLEASCRYLTHLRQAWDHQFPEHPLAEQDVTITVPASFDPTARELTSEAAELAGIDEYRLLEEPQAALYNWVSANAQWREQLAVGDQVLVIDVGGGTTDFSLITVIEQDGDLGLERVAVGEHILLGGDNMDLALAHLAYQKLGREPEDDWEFRSMALACRQAKEVLLSEDAPESFSVAIAGRGSKLIGSTTRVDIDRDAVRALIEDGYFPDCELDVTPAQNASSALRSLGLPYAQDPGISKHLAAFLRGAGSSGAGEAAMPNAVLFNGGVFKSERLRDRLVGTLFGWGSEPKFSAHSELDLACAKGAAYFGRIQGGDGIRIRGGLAKSFYVGVQSSMPAIPGFAPPMNAVCVAPFGLEEGANAEVLQEDFALVVGQPVQFSIYAANNRRDDKVGHRLPNAKTLEELAALEIRLDADGRPAGDAVPVRLQARVNDLGTLELDAHAMQGDDSWKLRFDLRANRD